MILYISAGSTNTYSQDVFGMLPSAFTTPVNPLI